MQACQLLYGKIIRLDQNGLSKISIGKVVNIMSNDVRRYNNAILLSLQATMSPFIIAAGIYLIYERHD